MQQLTQQAVQQLPHKSYDKAQLVLFAGVRGQGKTTAMSQYIETREPRVFMLDPFNDFRGLRYRESCEEALEEMASASAIRRRVVPPISKDSREWAREFFNRCVGGRVNEFSGGAAGWDREEWDGIERDGLTDCLLGLDEMTLWSNSDEQTELRTLILQGRRLGIRIVAACQRIALVPGVMLSECTQLVLFRTTRPRDLQVIAEWTDRKTAEIASKLQVGECIVVNL